MESKTDYEILRQHVISGSEPKQQAPDGQVRLDVISEVLNGNVSNSANNWKNFPLTLTIADFKKKLEMFSGTQPQYQKLQLYDKDNNLFAQITDDSKILSDYSPENGMKIFVIDADPNNTVKTLTDVSQEVEKFTLSDEDYNKREVTYRKWKEQNPDPKKVTKKTDYSNPPENIKIGDRCEVEPQSGGDLKRRGEVLYIGLVDGTEGYWIGVRLDEPLGKNDGSIKGKRYFTCPEKYGSIVRADKITVGDFPEEDLFEDEI